MKFNVPGDKRKDNDMILYTATIPLNPRTKKNSMQLITRPSPRLIQSKKYREYERDCLRVIKAPSSPINKPVIVKATYYRETRHSVDITNLNGALHDVLVKAGVLEDDNYKVVVGTDGSRIHFDKNNPRTEVEIYEV